MDDLQRRLNNAITDRDNTKAKLEQARTQKQTIPTQISQLTELNARL